MITKIVSKGFIDSRGETVRSSLRLTSMYYHKKVATNCRQFLPNLLSNHYKNWIPLLTQIPDRFLLKNGKLIKTRDSVILNKCLVSTKHRGCGVDFYYIMRTRLILATDENSQYSMKLLQIHPLNNKLFTWLLEYRVPYCK